MGRLDLHILLKQAIIGMPKGLEDKEFLTLTQLHHLYTWITRMTLLLIFFEKCKWPSTSSGSIVTSISRYKAQTTCCTNIRSVLID